MGRQPVHLLEPPQDLISTESCRRRHFGERRRVDELICESVSDPPQIQVRRVGAQTHRAVERHETHRRLDQRLFAGQGLRGSITSARVPTLEPAENPPQGVEQSRIVNHGTRDFRRRAAVLDERREYVCVH